MLFAIAREEEDNLLKHFQAITRGTKELKLNRHRRDDFMNNTLEASVRQMRQKNSHAMKIFAVSDGLSQLSLFLTLGFTLFIGPHFLNASLSLLATYALTITYLTMPFQKLLHGLPDLLRGNVSLRKIERMQLALAHEQEKEGVEARTVQPVCALELQYVTYHYPPEEQEAPPVGHPHGHPAAKPENPAKSHPHRRPLGQAEKESEQGFALGPISLSFQPGQITYLIGGNGSGKSTLAKLITGLYAPHSGAISLGGTRVTDQNREWYRQHISAVFSDFFLFDRCLGIDRPYLDEDVRHYLRQLQLDHKVQVQDGKLSTTRLSQGQRKRLALLMAYLEDRPIYLFDEWAADQEPAFRELFYTEILVKLKQQGKTVIVITHDDRYFYLADQLIKLDYGRVASAPAPLAAARR